MRYTSRYPPCLGYNLIVPGTRYMVYCSHLGGMCDDDGYSHNPGAKRINYAFATGASKKASKRTHSSSALACFKPASNLGNLCIWLSDPSIYVAGF